MEQRLRIRDIQDSSPLNSTDNSAGEPSNNDSHHSHAGPQTDFSVTNRLLQPYHVTPQTQSREPQHDYSTPGWQFLLPTDQGAVSSRHQAAWQTEVPNATLPFSSFSNQPITNTNGNSSHSLPSLQSVASVNSQQHQLPVGEAPQSGKTSDSDDANESGNETDGESSRSSHECSNAIDEPKKPKRTRTAYSNYQLDQLELVFTQTQYPDVFLREELSNRLAIKEDRIQVWFQNRRARFRKQERTGSVSFRSRYRQKRLQKVLQDTRTVMSAAMCPPSSFPASGSMLPSPQPIPPHLPSFPFTAQFTNTTSSTSSTADAQLGHYTPSTSNYRPGFHALRPTLSYPPLPGYLPRGMAGQNPPSYSTFHSGNGSTPVTRAQQ